MSMIPRAAVSLSLRKGPLQPLDANVLWDNERIPYFNERRTRAPFIRCLAIGAGKFSDQSSTSG